MINYPHKPFSDPPQTNETKQKRQKQLAEVRKRRGIIIGLMKGMKAK